MVLRFVKNCPPYVKGDIAGIHDKLAKKLIEGKYAISLETPKQDIKPDKPVEEKPKEDKNNKGSKK